jgi:hypothetical protein
MKKLLFIGMLAMAPLGAIAGAAGASENGRDFAVGAGTDGVGRFNFSAHRTVVGSVLASGHMSYTSPTQVVRADVVCLHVVGNQAFILGDIVQDRSSGTPEGFSRVAFEASDIPGGDQFASFFASLNLGCDLPPFGTPPSIESGNIVVQDRSP